MPKPDDSRGARRRPGRRPVPGLLLAACLFAGNAGAAEVFTSFSTRVDNNVPRKTMETEFTCSDTIYALIETRGLEAGDHQIEIHWIDPRGDRQELTQFNAYASSGDTLIWGWMRLHAPEDSGIARTFDPSHGMRIFIGEWTVRVYIDGRQRSSGRFDVLC